MIDRTTEDIIDLFDAAASLPGRDKGKPLHVATLYRWVSVGVEGRRLESIKIGNRTFTSKQAIDRFINGLSEQFVESLGDPVSRPRRRPRAGTTSTRSPERQAQIDAAMEAAREELAPRPRPTRSTAQV